MWSSSRFSRQKCGIIYTYSGENKEIKIMSKLTIIQPRTAVLNMTTEHVQNVFGLDNGEDLVALFDQICGPKTPAVVTHFAMGMMSDAQQVMVHNPERARHFLNQAKWLLSHVHDELQNQDMATFENA